MNQRVFPLVSILVLAAAVTAGGGAQSAGGTDWTQFRGPNRNGLSPDTGLLTSWPPGGPPPVWSSSDLGAGYGSVAVARERVFVQGLKDGQSVVTSLNRADGTIVWSTAIGPGLSNNRGSGPRSTPTVEGDRLYVLTENGDLAGLRVHDGSLLWQRNILSEFGDWSLRSLLGRRNIPWLVSESPLVDGDLVIVTPGGRNAGMAALDKRSGETVWVSSELSDEPGYASVIAADVQGVRTLMTFTAGAAVGVRASDGKLMWRYPRVANRTANIATPVFHDDKVFYTSSYGAGGALLGLRAGGGTVEAGEIYFTRDMQNHHGGVVLVGDYLYGFSNAILTCLEFATGKLMWRDRSVGKGSLAYADGHLYLLSENNVVGLAEATPSGYKEKGRFSIGDSGRPSWAHPVVSGGWLYIRNQGTLWAYDVRAR